jgi:hypothetical protein
MPGRVTRGPPCRAGYWAEPPLGMDPAGMASMAFAGTRPRHGQGKRHSKQTRTGQGTQQADTDRASDTANRHGQGKGHSEQTRTGQGTQQADTDRGTPFAWYAISGQRSVPSRQTHCKRTQTRQKTGQTLFALGPWPVPCPGKRTRTRQTPRHHDVYHESGLVCALVRACCVCGVWGGRGSRDAGVRA